MDRFIRFDTPEGMEWGLFEDGKIVGLTQNPALGVEESGKLHEPSAVRLLAPVEPSKIICVGLNYKEHVDESQSADKPPDEPLLFSKPPSALIGPGAKIERPTISERVDYEGELGIIIGQPCRNVAPVEADDYIFGFTCVNDVTARDLQRKDGQWTRAKGFDTFCPTGPWVTRDLNFEDLLIETFLNGELKQSSRTSKMIFPVPTLISHISMVMTLLPGDLIATGTPRGISPMSAGDRVEIRIEGIGSLVNDVI